MHVVLSCPPSELRAKDQALQRLSITKAATVLVDFQIPPLQDERVALLSNESPLWFAIAYKRDHAESMGLPAPPLQG